MRKIDRDAARQITAIVVSQTLASTNREKYEQMRDGVQITFRNDKGERLGIAAQAGYRRE